MALCADVVFILGVPFLIAISKKLKFIAIMPIASGSDDNPLEAFDQTFRVHNCNGFTIATLHVDPEFKFSEDAMIDNDIGVEWVAAQQHVPEIERTIGTGEDRCRCAHHSLPFQAAPKIMIEALAKRVVEFLNMFPPKEGVSEH